MTPLAVTFDFGQTLCDLDTDLLSRRLAERGLAARADRLEVSVTAGWRAYDDAIARGFGGHPWKIFMSSLLAGAGLEGPAAAAAVDWLWTEQPSRNLWRRPIAGMIELCRALHAGGVPVGIVSNSEGRLAELVEEIGWAADFPVVADSGKLGVQKPDPFIFRWAAERLGVAVESIVHVGDSWGADVEGALRAGMRAVWFRGRAERALPETVREAREAEEVMEALRGWGIAAA
jgi:HAD superfamily hydrolase (TIGR01662 family)